MFKFLSNFAPYLRESDDDDYQIASMRKFLGAIFACVLLMFSCTGKQAQRVEVSMMDSLTDTIDSVPMDTLEQLLSEIPTPKAMDELFDYIRLSFHFFNSFFPIFNTLERF